MTLATESASDMNERQPIRLLVISAVRLYRESLADAFSHARDFTVVDAVHDCDDALSRVRAGAVDVVLLDVGATVGHPLVRELAGGPGHFQLVAIGPENSEADMVACAEAGITGYVTRGASLQELFDAVMCAARGEVMCTPVVTGALVRRLASLAAVQRPAEAKSVGLTRREREIIALLERDLTNKEIATALGIEAATVKNHVHNVLDKLNVRRRSEAARLVGRERRNIA
jgi:two-component system, NarL family, nitrate/nitrite response regulator NarL